MSVPNEAAAERRDGAADGRVAARAAVPRACSTFRTRGEGKVTLRRAPHRRRRPGRRLTTAAMSLLLAPAPRSRRRPRDDRQAPVCLARRSIHGPTTSRTSEPAVDERVHHRDVVLAVAGPAPPVLERSLSGGHPRETIGDVQLSGEPSRELARDRGGDDATASQAEDLRAMLIDESIEGSDELHVMIGREPPQHRLFAQAHPGMGDTADAQPCAPVVHRASHESVGIGLQDVERGSERSRQKFLPAGTFQMLDQRHGEPSTRCGGRKQSRGRVRDRPQRPPRHTGSGRGGRAAASS